MQNIEQLQETRNNLRIALEHSLSTERGTAQARDEARRVLSKSLETCRCQSCNKPMAQHPKMNGYCRTCNARFDRMLNFKSKIKREMPRERALRSFIEDYNASENLPYSLRGCTDKAHILQYATDLLMATIALNEYIKGALSNGNKSM